MIRSKVQPTNEEKPPASNMRNVNVKWVQGYQFVGRGDSGHGVLMDAAKSIGGDDSGVRPGELVLVGLGGCTAFDIVSVLTTMRLTIDSFEVQVRAEPDTDATPQRLKEIWIKYVVHGDIPEKKLQKAIELSSEKYCSVGAMLKPGAKINYEYELNPKAEAEEEAKG